MSIDVREPGSFPTRGSRVGSTTSVGRLRPSGELLPSGGAPAPAPALTPQRALALDALRVLRLIRGPMAAEPAWADRSFGREIEAVRRQLAPIRSRSGLAASFSREAFHVRRATMDLVEAGGATTPPPGPVRLAYALRWLELGDGRPRPAWTDLGYRKMFSTR
jgi:hypothetical protein